MFQKFLLVTSKFMVDFTWVPRSNFPPNTSLIGCCQLIRHSLRSAWPGKSLGYTGIIRYHHHKQESHLHPAATAGHSPYSTPTRHCNKICHSFFPGPLGWWIRKPSMASTPHFWQDSCLNPKPLMVTAEWREVKRCANHLGSPNLGLLPCDEKSVDQAFRPVSHYHGISPLSHPP